ncbi:pentatricopeptide repeat-containing protein At5g64320, mitochondrial-like [Cryptomeria japonica]|uniref:pentatricopeptide repeat-containing protein At5g64320, mitochondrial-like n=1 Tax=Cryptomeria japonica TaxID=3369 RepID=UPI0027DA5CA1|nr:pentatricopeptide repeat-containing protein At5g64320, mitochondrial-like [Cryptomeria japonica]
MAWQYSKWKKHAMDVSRMAMSTTSSFVSQHSMAILQSGRAHNGRIPHGNVPRRKGHAQVTPRIEMYLAGYSSKVREDARGFCPVLHCSVTRLCEFHEMEKAQKLFKNMLSKGCSPDVVTYNTLIDGLCHSDREIEAFTLISEMENRGHLPDVITYNTLISAFCRTGEMNMVGKILEEMATRDLKLDEVTYTKVIDGLCKAGDFSRALSFFNKMLDEGSTPNENKLDMALSMLNEMRTKDLVPNVVTYNKLLRTFRERHDLEKTFWVMDQMKKEGCAPSDATVRILDWLVKVGQKQKLSLSESFHITCYPLPLPLRCELSEYGRFLNEDV